MIEDQRSLWTAGHEANQRYTKDLEEMLRRVVKWLEDGDTGIAHLYSLIYEAKALLERTE